MNRSCWTGVAGLGCVGVGCIAVIVLGFIGTLVIGGAIFLAAYHSMPTASRTATGIVVTNRMKTEDLVNSAITLKASSIAKPGLTADFTLKVPVIAAGKTVSFPYRRFHTHAGTPLDPAKFEVSDYKIAYHEPDGGSGSIGETLF